MCRRQARNILRLGMVLVWATGREYQDGNELVSISTSTVKFGFEQFPKLLLGIYLDYDAGRRHRRARRPTHGAGPRSERALLVSKESVARFWGLRSAHPLMTRTPDYAVDFHQSWRPARSRCIGAWSASHVGTGRQSRFGSQRAHRGLGERRRRWSRTASINVDEATLQGWV